MQAPVIVKPLLSDLVAQSWHVPSSHITAVGDRPDLAKVDHESGARIPLIDLKHLDGPERRRVVEAIGSACETDGFFMVTNHGIPESAVEGMLRVAREFFHLPESERLKCYSDDPKKAIRLSTSVNYVRTQKVSNWRDVLRLHCYPLESFVDQWPSNPPAFRHVVSTYSTLARGLALRLLEAISESLGLERAQLVNAMGRQAQQMAAGPSRTRSTWKSTVTRALTPQAASTGSDGSSDGQAQVNDRGRIVQISPPIEVQELRDKLDAFAKLCH